ncbi:MAG: sulfatase [Planctomycetota bacterium]
MHRFDDPRSLVFWAALLAVLCGCSLSRANRDAGGVAVHDIVVVMVDDLGWLDVGPGSQSVDSAAHAHFRTPNIDRLAREGVRFTQAYAAAPVCTPTRVSLITGQIPARHHATFWTLHSDRDTSGNHPRLLPPAWRIGGLDASATTLPDRLREVGYRTIHVGKAHFGANGTEAADPRALGFDRNVAGHAAGAPGSYFAAHEFRDSLRKGKPKADSEWDVPGLEDAYGTDRFLTEVLAERAVAEMGAAIDADVPFFLHFAPYAVHAPIMENPRYSANYPDLPPRERAYATLVQSVDAAVGEIVAELDRRGRLDRTIILFTSDNGGLSAHARDGEAHTHNRPVRSGKGSAYEGGIRVPAILRWPGVAAPGTKCAAPVITMDWTATLLAAAGAGSLPNADGIDVRSVLAGESTAVHRTLLWHMPHLWGPKGPGLEPFTAVRDGNLKLIWFHDSPSGVPRLELYDLAEDVGESNDLAGDRPDEVARLAARMRELATAVGAQPSRRKSDGGDLDWPAVAR